MTVMSALYNLLKGSCDLWILKRKPLSEELGRDYSLAFKNHRTKFPQHKSNHKGRCI